MRHKISIFIFMLLLSTTKMTATDLLEPKTDFERLSVILTKYGNNPENIQALHYAIAQNDLEAIDLLLKYGAIPCGECIFHAAKVGNQVLIQHLVESGVILNKHFCIKTLNAAIMEHQNAIVKYLLDIGICIAEQHRFYDCAFSGNLEAFNLLRNNGYELTEKAEFFGQLLCLANQVYSVQKLEMITNLLDQHIIDPDECTEYLPVIFYAAYGGDHPYRAAVLKLFLERGANPNVFDNNGYHILFSYANKAGKYFDTQKEAIQLLVDYGADINCKSPNGKTLLESTNDPLMRSFLISLGAG